MAKKQKKRLWWVPVVILRVATDTWPHKKGAEYRRSGDWAFDTKGEAHRAGEKMANAWRKSARFMGYWEIVGIEVEEVWLKK